jgi:hypothetical protein
LGLTDDAQDETRAEKAPESSRAGKRSFVGSNHWAQWVDEPGNEAMIHAESWTMQRIQHSKVGGQAQE